MSVSAFQAGNVAVVTGAALGIGRAMSKHFAALGMQVVMLDVDQEELRNAAEVVGSAARAIPFDVSVNKDWEELRSLLEKDGLVPSVLVNNAVTRIGRGFEADLSEWERSIDINVMGIVRGCKTLLPAMQASGKKGVIVNVGSKQGITNPPGHPIYNMGKAAIKIYTECLQHELREAANPAITAHLLVPGWTTTGKNEHRTGAWLPDQVVGHMMAAIEKGSFYIICPDDETTEEEDKQRIQIAADDIIEDREPLSRWLQTS
ncbi:MAG: SDR family NAD(P)-dependent oxidoreductase [Granulosicoccus sp.]|nr:SDR family NAD(P)-dependent oxidoreductase [Granulosicoccus sp.]